MCWSVEVSVAMTVAGGVATGVAHHQRQPAAIWLTLGYFTVMEALQVAGYLVIDQCGSTANRSVTALSYLHIVFQPFLINAFALELIPNPVRRRARVWVFALCGLSALAMLVQLFPASSLGSCVPGTPLCGDSLCTVSGNWHIAWNIPYNGFMVPLDQVLGLRSGFPTYMMAAFLLPLVYGAWRFVLVHALLGPTVAWLLTSNPNEMPAVWCLFSIAILCIALSPLVRHSMTSDTWWGVAVDKDAPSY